MWHVPAFFIFLCRKCSKTCIFLTLKYLTFFIVTAPYKSLSRWFIFENRKNSWDMPHDLYPKLYANVYISWKLFCVREIISQKVKIEIFVLCPEFTGVEQYFRNSENAMGNFILSSFGLTLILALWLGIKGVTLRMKKKFLQVLATWCPTLTHTDTVSTKVRVKKTLD